MEEERAGRPGGWGAARLGGCASTGREEGAGLGRSLVGSSPGQKEATRVAQATCFQHGDEASPEQEPADGGRPAGRALRAGGARACSAGALSPAASCPSASLSLALLICQRRLPPGPSPSGPVEALPFALLLCGWAAEPRGSTAAGGSRAGAQRPWLSGRALFSPRSFPRAGRVLCWKMEPVSRRDADEGLTSVDVQSFYC